MEVEAPAGGISETEFTVVPARLVVPHGRFVAFAQASFEGGDKIYDGTLVPSSLIGTISGQVAKERVNLTSFDSEFSVPTVGYNLINLSNLIVSSNNYYVHTIIPLYANIYYKNLDITFSGGSKIYDSTRYVGPSINGVISGIENNIAVFAKIGRDQISIPPGIIDYFKKIFY